MLLLLLLLAVAIGGSHGQFPRVCMTKEALDSEICCPLWNGSECGVEAMRGVCLNWWTRTLDDNQYYDDRLNWPNSYFRSSCECLGNYGGFDCGKCKFGYYGENCDRQKTLVRHEIRELSTIERRRFFSYLTLAKYTISKDYVILVTGDRHHRSTYKFIDATIYDVFSWIHYYSMKPILMNSTFTSNTSYAHQGPAFPGWHRRLLLFLEREIQELIGDEDFALPYYDWSHENNTCSICNEEFLGSNDLQGNIGGSSYFSSWGAICSGYFYTDAYCRSAERGFHVENLLRKPGRDPKTRIPTYQDVEATLKWKMFDTEPFDKTSKSSFRNALEGYVNPVDGKTTDRNMHNMFHGYIGGTMSQVPISANDPMFILHHAYIDKLFEVWIRKNKATPDKYPNNQHLGHQRLECAMPFFPCVMNKHMLQNSAVYGYTFTYMDQYCRLYNQVAGGS
ncbi:tyrosinase-like [Hyla sarda]|uniref:tyrosinase-like n=1 Tax=Hyla sarda TaxID=327740 RepID=UPI0024C40897|nr:tyrosinase-like [Hyla sarda]XP_056408551.1 tyrosinase-like [Hyla sarda]XP_056408552.1 tyrosinase-like [Hyla sarda]XP_056408553.1 tyrosinase-like [Hyla sarda]XP_056408554.1 tyrosinase-like [Hyla sarda]